MRNNTTSAPSWIFRLQLRRPSRRAFLVCLASIALTSPLPIVAQQPKVPRIGALYIGIADAETFRTGASGEDCANLATAGRDQTLHSSLSLRRRKSWIDFPTSPPSSSASEVEHVCNRGALRPLRAGGRSRQHETSPS